MQRKGFIRLAQAFNAACKSAAIENLTFTPAQRQIIFDQLALACSDLATGEFSHSKFENACTEL